MTNNDLGVLVVGHGTRDAFGQAQMRSLACQTAGCLSPLKTDLGFLELAEPSIQDGIKRLADTGVKQLITVPVLLFRAGHADSDIPEAVDAAAKLFGIKVLHQTDPLESRSTVLQLSAERYREALAERACQHVPSEQVALAMIARGSSSDSAAQAMELLVEKRCQMHPVQFSRAGYVAVRKPNVTESLDWLASLDAQVLVVQPHLLFEGEVYHSICEAVAKRQENDTRQWVVCKPLGADADNFDDTRLASVLAQSVFDYLQVNS